jgi:hypothetical protein
MVHVLPFGSFLRFFFWNIFGDSWLNSQMQNLRIGRSWLSSQIFWLRDLSFLTGHVKLLDIKMHVALQPFERRVTGCIHVERALSISTVWQCRASLEEWHMQWTVLCDTPYSGLWGLEVIPSAKQSWAPSIPCCSSQECQKAHIWKLPERVPEVKKQGCQRRPAGDKGVSWFSHTWTSPPSRNVQKRNWVCLPVHCERESFTWKRAL